MPNHPNLNKNNRCANPSPDQIRALRVSFNLTQKEFGEICCCTKNAVTQWESGARNLHPIIWEMYLIYFGKAHPRNYTGA